MSSTLARLQMIWTTVGFCIEKEYDKFNYAHNENDGDDDDNKKRRLFEEISFEITLYYQLEIILRFHAFQYTLF